MVVLEPSARASWSIGAICAYKQTLFFSFPLHPKPSPKKKETVDNNNTPPKHYQATMCVCVCVCVLCVVEDALAENLCQLNNNILGAVFNLI